MGEATLTVSMWALEVVGTFSSWKLSTSSVCQGWHLLSAWSYFYSRSNRKAWSWLQSSSVKAWGQMGTIHLTLSVWHIFYFSRASAELPTKLEIVSVEFTVDWSLFFLQVQVKSKDYQIQETTPKHLFLRSSDVKANDCRAIGHWRIHELKLLFYSWEIWATAVNRLIKK